MMKRILVPLDGSPLAERALAVAANLARSTDGALILVQALTLPVEYDSLLVPHLTPLDIESKGRAAQAYLTRQVNFRCFLVFLLRHGCEPRRRRWRFST